MMSTLIEDRNYNKLAQVYQILTDYNDHTYIDLRSYNLRECIKVIIDQDFDINYQLKSESLFCQKYPRHTGYTALHLVTVYCYDKDLLDFLIEKGADLTIQASNGDTPLLTAPYLDQDLDYLLLIYLKKNVCTNFQSEKGVSHFHLACATNLVNVVDFFLKSGSSLDNRISDDDISIYGGCTPLHLAIINDRLETIKLLLIRGANVHIKDKRGGTPLQYLLEKCDQKFLSVIPDLILQSLGLTKLHINCISNKIDLVNFFNEDVGIDTPIKFDSPLWPGYTPLHLASKYKNFQKVIFLLQKGADLLIKSADDKTPFDFCLHFNLDEIIQILSSEKLHKLSQIKLTDGSHLINVLESLQDSNKLKKLIGNKVTNMSIYIPFDSPIWPGFNLLHLKVIYLHSCIITSLSCNKDFTMLNADEFPNDCVNQNNLSHLHVACAEKHYKAMEHLLQNGSDPNLAILSDIFNDSSRISAGSTALFIAVENLDYNAIELLLSHGANPDAINIDELLNDYMSYVVKDVQKMKIPVYFLNDKNKTQITKAVAHTILQNDSSTLNAPHNCKRLISQFFEEKQYEQFGLTKLQVACAIGDLSMVKEEIKSGSNINEQINFDSDIWPGDSALHILFRKNSWLKYEIARILLKHGADLTLKNASNDTPFHLIKDEELEIATLLLTDKFTNVNPANNYGLSHFHLVCKNKNFLIVEEFLNSGVNINAVVDCYADNDAGFTPLHFAVKYGSKEIIQLLLSHGADTNIQDAFGDTPFHLIISPEEFKKNRVKDLLRCPAINLQAKNRFGETVIERSFENCIHSSEDLYSNTSFLTTFTIDLLKNNHLCMDLARFTAENIHGSKFIVNTAFYVWPYAFQRLINGIIDLTDADNKGQNAVHHILDTYPLSAHCSHSKKMELITSNYHENIKVLVRAGCEVNHKDNKGKTALHKVLLTEGRFHDQTVGVLLSLGADINITDDDGKTPYFYIKKGKRKIVTKALSNHIFKLLSFGLHIDNTNERDHGYSDEFIASIIKEKAKLVKKFKTVDLSISVDFFYSEMFVVGYRRMSAIQRQAICSICDSDNLPKHFPSTHDLINLQFGKARARTRLIEPATNALRSLAGVALPELCLELIFDHLNNYDLMNLVRADNGKLIFASLPENY